MWKRPGEGCVVDGHGAPWACDGKRPACLQTSRFLETEVPTIADDDVVQHGDAEDLSGCDQSPRDGDIVGRRGGITAGVIVRRDQTRGIT